MSQLTLHSANNISIIASPLDHQDISQNSPATAILTDFTTQMPLMIDDSTKGEEVEYLMKKEHVRLKLVVNDNDQFMGVVTLNSLNNQEIVKKVAAGFDREELMVSEFMQPRSELTMLDSNELKEARIKDVLEVLQHVREQHILVMDKRTDALIGLISTTDIIRKLSLPLDVTGMNTFAGVYKYLKH